MRDEGVLMGFGLGFGGRKKTLRFMPPFAITKEDIQSTFEKLSKVLNKL